MNRRTLLAVLSIGVIAIVVATLFIMYQPGEESDFLWTFKDEAAGFDYSSPALDDQGNVYFGSAHKWYQERDAGSLTDHYFVYCYSQETGEEQWKYDLGAREVRGGPVLGKNGEVFIVAEAHDADGFRTTDEIVALNSDGTFAWSQTITSNIPVDPSRPDEPPYDQQHQWSLGILEPAIDTQNNIYVAGEKLWSFYDNGTLRWSYESGYVCASPTVVDDLVLFPGRTLYALDRNTGDLEWTYEAEDTRMYKPSISGDGTIIFGTEKHLLVALDSEGNEVWTHDLGSDTGAVRCNPAIDNDGVIYFGTKNNDGSELYAINPDGSVKWKYDAPLKDLYCSPALGDTGNLYISSEDMKLFIISMSDGELVREVNLERDGTWSSPVINAEGVLFIGDLDGNFYAIKTDCTGLADVPWPCRSGSPERFGHRL